MHYLIAGDSWSQGEWIGIQVTHLGLHQYLIDDNHIVTNVGKAGLNNHQSWKQVLSAIYSEIDHLIFFYTDSLRQVRIIDFENYLPSQIVENHVDWFINQVKILKTEYPHLKVTVIGGAGCFPKNTDAIDYIIPSMTTLLFPDFKDHPYLTSHKNTFDFFLESKFFKPSFEQKKEFIEIIDMCNSKQDFWRSHPEYFPDGGHPGRIGHLKLYHHLQAIWA